VKDVKHHLEDSVARVCLDSVHPGDTEMYGQMNFLVRTPTVPQRDSRAAGAARSSTKVFRWSVVDTQKQRLMNIWRSAVHGYAAEFVAPGAGAGRDRLYGTDVICSWDGERESWEFVSPSGAQRGEC